ncbi:MAG: cyclic nucleotide-binding/CBS domain-containing protein [Desulfatiglandales bacterium]
MRVGYALRNMMTPVIITLDAESSLGEAMRLMVEKDIGSVVVTRGKEMVGIITERDVVKKICVDHECALMKVGNVMSSPLVTIDGGATLGEAAEKMAEKRIRRLLVTDEGEIAGLVTERDILKATLDVFKKLSNAWV